MRFFTPSLIPFFLTASRQELSTELKSTMTPSFHRVLNKYQNGQGLDVNCWTGESTKQLEKKFPDIRFTGIDKNERAIDVARKRYYYSDFCHVDIEKKSNCEYDMFQIIQISNYDNLEKVLQNTFHLLHEDGMMILRYHDKDIDYVHQLLEKNYRFRPNVVHGTVLHKMYLFEERNTAIIFK